MDAGLDSLSGQEMKSQIEEEFEVELPVTAAFDFPSVAALADYVFGKWVVTAARKKSRKKMTLG